MTQRPTPDTTANIVGLTWGRPSVATPPIEVYTVAELFAQRGVVEMSRVQRPLFHVTLVPTAGAGVHTVDFVEVEVRPGRLVDIQPGQVMSWAAPPTWDGYVVARPPAPTAGQNRWFHGSPAAVSDLPEDDWARLRDLLSQTRDEIDRFEAGSHERTPLLAALAGVVEAHALLAQRLPSNETIAPLPDAYVAFRTVLEDHLSDDLSVEQLASRAGFSLRTITRACVTVTGLTAKQLRDERMVLEARRLMCYTDLSIGDVAAHLGFSEPTNFTKSFRRLTGATPSQARAAAEHVR